MRVFAGLYRAVPLVAVAPALLAGSAAGAALGGGQPHTTFSVADFGKLRWLEGTWHGTSPGGPNVYERYRFVNDTVINITYYGDPALSRETGSGRVYMSAGRVYHTFGPGRWSATSVGAAGVYFVPQANARNSFAWARQGADSWTSTLRSGATGRETVIVYRMQRMR